jgi:hypothetical protein
MHGLVGKKPFFDYYVILTRDGRNLDLDKISPGMMIRIPRIGSSRRSLAPRTTLLRVTVNASAGGLNGSLPGRLDDETVSVT